MLKLIRKYLQFYRGSIAQSVMCLTAYPGVASSQSHTFEEIDHVIIFSILLPSADSRRVVSYKQKYVHEVLVNHLVKLAQEKCVVR